MHCSFSQGTLMKLELLHKKTTKQEIKKELATVAYLVIKQ